MNYQIIGTGSSHPAYAVTNEELSRFIDTSDEWITSHTGIKSRYVSTGETLTDLAADAAQNALENAGISAQELDLIICATIRGDYMTPSLACVVQQKIGAGCPAFDLNAACPGFVYALDVAAGYFARKTVKKVLVIAAEMMTKLVDWKDRSTCVLFGDGAGAVVLGEGDNLLSIKLTASGNTSILSLPNVNGNSPFCDCPKEDSFLKMNGPEVYKFAVAAMIRDLEDVIAQAGLTKEDITYVLPHQANLRIINTVKKKFGVDPEKFLINIERHGNISSACIPTLLDELNRENFFRRGDILALTAMGAGLTTGACILRW